MEETQKDYLVGKMFWNIRKTLKLDDFMELLVMILRLKKHEQLRAAVKRCS